MPPSTTNLTIKQNSRRREVQLIKRSIAVTAVYMLAELVIGYQFSVLSLVADSHMMNDLAAFVLQLYANEIGELERPHGKDTTAFSFGFGRVEFLANLIQGVLLLALCLTLALESLQRFYSSETITLPPIVVGMGVAGLVWNLVMFRMFESNHGGGEDEHSLVHPIRYRQRVQESAVFAPYCLAHAASDRTESRSRVERSLSRNNSHASSGHSHGHSHASDDSHDHSLGFLGGFLSPENSLAIHALGDAAGNFAVIIDGIASWLLGPKNGRVSGVLKSWSGVAYVDPLCSLVVVYVILIHAFPLVTKSSFALMHAFDPAKTSAIKKAFRRRDWLPRGLANEVAVELEELHVWALSDTSRFATASLMIHGDGHVHLSALDVVEIEAAAKRLLYDVAPPAQVTVEVHLTNAPYHQLSPIPSHASSRAPQHPSTSSHPYPPAHPGVPLRRLSSTIHSDSSSRAGSTAPAASRRGSIASQAGRSRAASMRRNSVSHGH